MPSIQVANITPDLLRVNLPSLSFLGFINISTTFSLQKFWRQERNECYFQNDFSDRRRYFELTDMLLRLSTELKLPGLTPLAQLTQFEFIVDTDYWPTFINKMAQNDLLELRNIATELSTVSQTQIQEPFIQSNTNSGIVTEGVTVDIKLIDLDKSIENKLIFYYLFQANLESVERIAEKIDLMTMEQKEMFIEQIFQKSPLQKLPKIIYTQPFCTLKLNASLSELLPLISSNKIKLIIQKPKLQSLNNLDEEISNSPHYNQVLTVLSEIKTFCDQNQNNYVLPLGLRQTVLLALDLQGLAELNKLGGTLKEKIFHLINQEAPFTKGFINN